MLTDFAKTAFVVLVIVAIVEGRRRKRTLNATLWLCAWGAFALGFYEWFFAAIWSQVSN